MTQERCQVCGGEGLFYASYGDQMDHKLTKCDCTALKESPEPDFVKPIAREQSFLPGICPHKHMVFCSCLCQAHDLIATAIRNAPNDFVKGELDATLRRLLITINTEGCRG